MPLRKNNYKFQKKVDELHHRCYSGVEKRETGNGLPK